MTSRAPSLVSSRPWPLAASWYQLARQLRQKPARFIRSMFCTSLRSRRCSTSRRKAAASSSVTSVLSILVMAPISVRPSRGVRRRAATLRQLVGAAGVTLSSMLRIFSTMRQKPLRPCRLARGVADQVLADLDDGVGEPALRAVLPQAVALELARIGLVVADDQVALGIEAVEQRLGEPRVAVPQHADVPGPRQRPSSSR